MLLTLDFCMSALLSFHQGHFPKAWFPFVFQSFCTVVLYLVTLTILLYVHRSEIAYLGRGQWGEGVGRVKARPRIPPEKDRRDRGPPPEQWKCLRRCPLAIAQRLVHGAIAVSTAVLGRVINTKSVALLLRNNSKRKKSNFRSPPPPPCSWSLLG